MEVPKMGLPQSGWFSNGKSYSNGWFGGYPHFRKPPYITDMYIFYIIHHTYYINIYVYLDIFKYTCIRYIYRYNYMHHSTSTIHSALWEALWQQVSGLLHVQSKGIQINAWFVFIKWAEFKTPVVWWLYNYIILYIRVYYLIYWLLSHDVTMALGSVLELLCCWVLCYSSKTVSSSEKIGTLKSSKAGTAWWFWGPHPKNHSFHQISSYSSLLLPSGYVKIAMENHNF